MRIRLFVHRPAYRIRRFVHRPAYRIVDTNLTCELVAIHLQIIPGQSGMGGGMQHMDRVVAGTIALLLIIEQEPGGFKLAHSVAHAQQLVFLAGMNKWG